MEVTEGTAWEHDVKARLIARDPGALTEMYDQFGSYVFGLAARVIGDRRAAEDVTQDVFLSLWERPEAFDPERGACAPSSARSRTAGRSTSCAGKRHDDDATCAMRRRSCRSPTSTSSRSRS